MFFPRSFSPPGKPRFPNQYNPQISVTKPQDWLRISSPPEKGVSPKRIFFFFSWCVLPSPRDHYVEMPFLMEKIPHKQRKGEHLSQVGPPSEAGHVATASRIARLPLLPLRDLEESYWKSPFFLVVADTPQIYRYASILRFNTFSDLNGTARTTFCLNYPERSVPIPRRPFPRSYKTLI